MRDWGAWAAAVAFVGIGCSAEPTRGSAFDASGSGPASATGDSSAGTDAGVGSTSDSDSDADSDLPDPSGALFDVPSEDPDTGSPLDGCSKVDFLFIIDNSISMGDEQQNLSSSFPAFISTIQQEVVEDYHVMVVDTDGEDKWDEELTECLTGDCDGEEANEPCGVNAPESEWLCGSLPIEDVCDATLGAGTDHDGSDGRASCGLAGNRRWFDDTQSNPGQTFECMANLYDGNSPELTMDAMLSALSAQQNGPGGCNEGFLRDDAVLVVTFISDEEDAGDSIGDPASWRSELLALKGGNETALVVLGLLGDTTLPAAVCPPDSVAGSNGGEYSPRLIEFVESFANRGVWGSVCSPDYSSFFEQAVTLVDTACDEFVPEG